MPLHLKPGQPVPLGPDPHSFAEWDPDSTGAVVTELRLALRIDFEKRNLHGFVDLVIGRGRNENSTSSPASQPDYVVLDVNLDHIAVQEVCILREKAGEDGQEKETPAKYDLGYETSAFGDAMKVYFPPSPPINCMNETATTSEGPDEVANKILTTIRIKYHTISAAIKPPVAPAPQAPAAKRKTASAVQWLRKEQTKGKVAPLAFSQAQAILARSFVPCQDTPAVKHKLDFKLTVDTSTEESKELVAICSGELQQDWDKTVKDTQAQQKTFHYRQETPIPAYLIAFVVARFERAKIGENSYVFAEPEILDFAQKELSGVCDKYLKTASGTVLLGSPYYWGKTFNVAIMPNSFAFGGMENPNCTFFSASLLAGDQSLTTTLAHEITHSWTGNLVTNKLHEDFWLNEGFTRYVERRILGEIFGEDFRELCLLVGFKDLKKNVDLLTSNNQVHFTALNPGKTLVGVDPDEAFSRVPYEKGSVFLLYLERVVLQGRTELMSAWLKEYLEDFKFQSVSTEEFREHFIRYFRKHDSKQDEQEHGTNVLPQELVGIDIDRIDWEKWLYGPGMPEDVQTGETPLIAAKESGGGQVVLNASKRRKMIDEVEKLVEKWTNGHCLVVLAADAAAPATSCSFVEDLNFIQSSWKAQQVMLFLDLLIEALDKNEFQPTEEQAAAFWSFDETNNVEIRFRFLLFKLKESASSRHREESPALVEPRLEAALDLFFGQHGRGSYVKPLYLQLKNSNRMELARKFFLKHKDFYQDTIAIGLAKSLGV